jgi:hypothetical protein
MRDIEEPVHLPNGDEIHPAFGVVTVTRSSGSPRSLFQSDLQHNETITLAVHTATRKRDLHHDWVHPDREIVEIEMSLAQWGAVVSSMGQGSGTPVTVRRRNDGNGYRLIPDIPFQPRLQEGLAEVRETTGKLLTDIRSSLTKLSAAVHGKLGVKATKAALRDVEAAVGNAESNSEFVIKSLNKQGEHVVSQAKADIESYLLQVKHQTGLTGSIEVPNELES